MYGALERGEFIPYYQPQYDLKTERIVSAEALVRWKSPDQGFLSPGEFIPLFEKNAFFFIFYDLRDIMAQNVSHCIFCSDLFHPKSLLCAVISSICYIIHPEIPLCQNMCVSKVSIHNKFSQQNCLHGPLQPVIISCSFYGFPIQNINAP